MNTFLHYKYHILVGLLLFITANINAQDPSPTSDKNYVMEHIVRVPDITDKSQLGGKTVSHWAKADGIIYECEQSLKRLNTKTIKHLIYSVKISAYNKIRLSIKRNLATASIN